MVKAEDAVAVDVDKNKVRVSRLLAASKPRFCARDAAAGSRTFRVVTLFRFSRVPPPQPAAGGGGGNEFGGPNDDDKPFVPSKGITTAGTPHTLEGRCSSSSGQRPAAPRCARRAASARQAGSLRPPGALAAHGRPQALCYARMAMRPLARLPLNSRGAPGAQRLRSC